MAISPPSDIVLDVAQAVGKPDLEAARARLAEASAARQAGAFALSEQADAGMEAQATRKGKESFVKFESMVLRNFVEAMLPKESEAVYGKGLAGDMWKSMMAERVADVMAQRGGIGIADRVLGDYYMDGDRKVPVSGVSQGPERAARDAQAMLSDAMVQEIQRDVMKAYGQTPIAGRPDDES